MRRARVIVLAFLCASFTAVASEAVTLKDVIDLTKAGLGDDVLIALIEVDGGVFDVDAATLTRLKAAGVNEKVIVALVRSGRTRPPQEEPPTLANVVDQQQAPEVRYIEAAPTTIVQQVVVPVPVPVYVGIATRNRHVRSEDRSNGDRTITVAQPPIGTALEIQNRLPKYLTDTPAPSKKPQPEYWGFGGKLRPDAWKPQ
jgi:hypothetical protein